MTRLLTIVALSALWLMLPGSVVFMAPSSALAAGATQIEGSAVFADLAQCPDLALHDADFALIMSGDLQGCLYTIVETFECSPSGTYRETGREVFVGTYNGGSGTFTTNYHFQAKYLDCPNLSGEIFGRCEHPIVGRSGTGVFSGVTGRLDFKDEVETVTFFYRGHLRK